LKFWSKNRWANVSTYAKLAALTAAVVVGEPMLMERFGHEHVDQQQQGSTPRVASDPQEGVVPNPLQTIDSTLR
jgi:hypothetical protein